MNIDFAILRIGDEIAEYTDCDEVDLANALTAIEPILKEQADTHASELRAYEATVENLVEALRGVIRVADRDTVEFDAAKAAILNAVGE
jgi:ATP phosphoribosyltransferase